MVRPARSLLTLPLWPVLLPSAVGAGAADPGTPGLVTNPVIAQEIEERCSVAGPTDCNIRDLVYLKLAIDADAPNVETRCDAALSPAPAP